MSVKDVEQVVFHGVDGHRIIGDAYGTGDRIVLLVHGGGQTRHAWEATAERLMATGVRAVTIDQRGHGDSEWHRDGLYSFEDYAKDLEAVAVEIRARYGMRPVVVGASLGGLASIIAEGKSDEQILKALILVDVTPKMELGGVSRILNFMADRMREGFSTIDEAAEVIAAYLPQRKRPASAEGLKKNLRLHEDGRYRWHWDPRFLDGPRPIHSDRETMFAWFDQAARNLTIPVMLVRGALSELVTEELAEEFLKTVPHAKYVDVSDAGHMVAGDRNDVFADAVIGFLGDLDVL